MVIDSRATPRRSGGLPAERNPGPMKVGVPKEVKNHEYRVALTPIGVHELVQNGHEVYIEAGAGVGSSIPDEEYVAAGATMLPGADDVWGTTDMLLKVQ